MRSEALARSRKRRNGYEFLCEVVFRPLAHPLVLVLARLHVPPPAVVFAAGAAGIGVGSAINKLDSEVAMVAAVRSLVEALATVSRSTVATQ